jgi:hypothetical protein
VTDERVIDLVVEQATVRLENQFRDVDALDVKALGVLGADAAALALLVATHGSLNNLWWLPTCGLAVSGLLLLLCVCSRAKFSRLDSLVLSSPLSVRSSSHC